MRARSVLIVTHLMLVALLCDVALAEPLDSAYQDDIVRLMGITDVAKNAKLMASQMATAMFNGLKQSVPGISDGSFDIVNEVVQSEFGRSIDAKDGLMSQLIPLYAKYFTHEDILAMLSFYQSDLGHKMLTAMPALIQESSQIGQEWATTRMPAVQAEIKRRLKAAGYVK